MALVTNLLKNGDFSQGNESWIIEDPEYAEIITDTDPSKCYLKLRNFTGEKQYIVKQIVSIKPNRRYDLIAQIFYLQGTGDVWRKWQKPGENQSYNTSLSEQIYINEATPIDEQEIIGNWRMHFFTEENATQLEIAFAAVTDSPPDEFITGISNVFLYENNLITNGDFSNNDAGWSFAGQNHKFPEGPYGKFLEITVANARQDIVDIKPNTGYRLLFKNQSLYSGQGGTVQVYSNDNTSEGRLAYEFYNNRSWETKRLDFETKDDTLKITIDLSTGSSSQFDEFTLAEVKRDLIL